MAICFENKSPLRLSPETGSFVLIPESKLSINLAD